MPLDKHLKIVALGRWDDVANRSVGADSALATEHPDYRRLRNTYAASRSDADRDALPLKEGKRPLLWHVAVPTPEQWAVLADMPQGAKRASYAVLACVTGVTDRTGQEHKPAERRNGIAADAWLERVTKAGGGALVLELGDAVYLRGLVGDRDEGDGDPLAL